MKTVQGKIVVICFILHVLPITLAAADGFYIRDGVLMDAKGYPFIMRGVSVPFAWFNSDSYNALPVIAALKANTIRIVWTQNMTASRLDEVMKRCVELKMVPVPELHDVTGKDDAGSLNTCANYWARSDVKAVLSKYRKEAIVNIANEWMGAWGKTTEWVNAYKNAIFIMRNAGINNTILVDAGGWGQDYTYVLNGALEVLASDAQKNVLFAVHMYGQYGTAAKVQTAIHGILGKKIPFIVGEFGWNHSDGDVDEMTILSECREHNVGFLAWSWKGNGGGVEYLDLSTSWTSSSALTDWGKTVFTSANGIGATSRVCTIFTNDPPTGVVKSRFNFYVPSMRRYPVREYTLAGRSFSSTKFCGIPGSCGGARIVPDDNGKAVVVKSPRRSGDR